MTICLIILCFTEGLKVWSVENQTNWTETSVLSSIIRQRTKRDTFTEVEPMRGLYENTITIEEGSSVTFKCNPFQENCLGCDGHAEEYAPFYICESPCKWTDVKAYSYNYKSGYDERFRVHAEDKLSNNRYGMRVELKHATRADQGRYYCALDLTGTDWYETIDIMVVKAARPWTATTMTPFLSPASPEVELATEEELAWMGDGDTSKDQINPEVQKAMMKCQGNKACALAVLQKEELEIKTSCWMCLQMSHAWKAVPLMAATVNKTKCLIPQQMTDVLKTVVDLEEGRTPTNQPADDCNHIQQYNNTDIAIPPLRVTYARGDVCICFNKPRMLKTGWSDCRIKINVKNGTMNNCTAIINNKEINFTCPFHKPNESSPAAVWVCGDRAYHSLPKKDWSGCCYPALMNVGTSVYLPSKVGKRERRDIKILPGALPNHYAGYTLTDPWTTPGANIGWSIFLGVGTAVTINKINGLAWTVLAIANSTENALTLISDEMRQLRDAVIQNRLVLDMLTAERGGVCKMLGVSCCFNIPDYSDNITNIIEHMREAVREPERIDNQWAGWFMSLWGGWVYWIIQTVLPIVVIGILILFCLPCIMRCISSSVQRLVRAESPIQAVKLTAYPIDSEHRCDDYESDESDDIYTEM